MRRALAEHLVRHAARTMPAHRCEWGLAMNAELAAIDSAAEALIFAAGCVCAAYRERISPMRIALLSGRLAVAAVSLLTAAAHAFPPVYYLAMIIDLKRHGQAGWAGNLGLFHGQTVDGAIAAILSVSPWHEAAVLGLAVAFGAAAWFLVRWNVRKLMVTVLGGVVAATANLLSLWAVWPRLYLYHPALALADYLALLLLLAAVAAFWGLDRFVPKTSVAA